MNGRILMSGSVPDALSMDRAEPDPLYASLKQSPKVETVGIKALSLQAFRETTGLLVLIMAGIFSAFALTIDPLSPVLGAAISGLDLRRDGRPDIQCVPDAATCRGRRRACARRRRRRASNVGVERAHRQDHVGLGLSSRRQN